MRQRVCVAWRLTELLVQVGGRGGEDLHAPALGSSPDAGPADGGGQGRTHRMRDATSGCMPIYAPAACAKRRARISFAGVPLRNASTIQRCAMCPKAIYLALPKLLAPAQVAERRIMEDCMVAAWEVATLGTQVPKGQTCPHSRNRTSVPPLANRAVFQSGTPACLPTRPCRQAHQAVQPWRNKRCSSLICRWTLGRVPAAHSPLLASQCTISVQNSCCACWLALVT